MHRPCVKKKRLPLLMKPINDKDCDRENQRASALWFLSFAGGIPMTGLDRAAHRLSGIVGCAEDLI